MKMVMFNSICIRIHWILSMDWINPLKLNSKSKDTPFKWNMALVITHTHTSYLQISKQQQSECTLYSSKPASWFNEWGRMEWIGVRTNKSHYRLNWCSSIKWWLILTFCYSIGKHWNFSPNALILGSNTGSVKLIKLSFLVMFHCVVGPSELHWKIVEKAVEMNEASL